MTDLRHAGSAGGLSCFCSACDLSSAMSRRQFLCTGTVGAVAAASVAGVMTAFSGTALAQQPAGTPGRPILIKGGCVLTLDRAIGDFETAEVLIEGKVMKRNGQMIGLDFTRLQRLGDETRDRVYAAAKVKNSRI